MTTQPRDYAPPRQTAFPTRGERLDILVGLAATIALVGMFAMGALVGYAIGLAAS